MSVAGQIGRYSYEELEANGKPRTVKQTIPNSAAAATEYEIGASTTNKIFFVTKIGIHGPQAGKPADIQLTIDSPKAEDYATGNTILQITSALCRTVLPMAGAMGVNEIAFIGLHDVKDLMPAYFATDSGITGGAGCWMITVDATIDTGTDGGTLDFIFSGFEVDKRYLAL